MQKLKIWYEWIWLDSKMNMMIWTCMYTFPLSTVLELFLMFNSIQYVKIRHLIHKFPSESLVIFWLNDLLYFDKNRGYIYSKLWNSPIFNTCIFVQLQFLLTLYYFSCIYVSKVNTIIILSHFTNKLISHPTKLILLKLFDQPIWYEIRW